VTIAIPHKSRPAAVGVEARALRVPVKVDLKGAGNFTSLKRGMRVAGFLTQRKNNLSDQFSDVSFWMSRGKATIVLKPVESEQALRFNCRL
jgi:hypothetical protein